MTENEFLQGVDLIWNKLGETESEVEYAEMRDRLAWLVSEYKKPNKEKANWWKEDL